MRNNLTSRCDISHIIAMEVNVSTYEHVTDGPLSSGSHEALHFVERGVRHHCDVGSSFFPFPLCSSLFFSSSFWSFSSRSYLSSLPTPPLLFLSHPPSLPLRPLSFARATSFAFSSRSYTCESESVLSVLPRIPSPSHYLSNRHLRRLPPSATLPTTQAAHPPRLPSSSTRPVVSRQSPPARRFLSVDSSFLQDAKRPRPRQTFPILID